MRSLTVDLKDRSYPIHIGEGLYPQLPQLLTECGIQPDRPLMLVTDTQVGPLYMDEVKGHLESAGYRVGTITVPAGESSKSLSRLEAMVEECIRFGLDRAGVVLALGGGVVGDLAGFLAASYMRGISFVQLPTTLLAHDSSVGGKVGVNHPLGKNMIGAFHQPEMVVFDVSTLRSLPEREVVSGYAEVVKHALIWDASFARWLHTNASDLLHLDPEKVGHAIYQGCQVKAAIVSQDEKESGLRAILNYGHTLGHALESAAGYGTYTHGEAVAIGMAAASMLGEELGTAQEVSGFTRELLRQFRLPVSLSGQWDEELLLEHMKRDKKARQGGYAFVLPRSIGEVQLYRDIEEQAIVRVLNRLKEGTT
ncbi:3-dehydroquinate synthase [Marinithermofilum abyssi]|nr:3-dehydroquinate synthase [Marinithermofilum abyssi]